MSMTYKVTELILTEGIFLWLMKYNILQPYAESTNIYKTSTNYYKKVKYN